jgi:uncharacterized membrane protein YfcA
MIEAALIGAAGGVVAGMLGVGGGVIFVPGLVIVAGLSQVDAEATSLLAILPVALVGAWSQHRYGNVRLREGVLIGVLSVPGVAAGVALVNVLPVHVIKVGFAVLLIFVAVRLASDALGRDGA